MKKVTACFLIFFAVVFTALAKENKSILFPKFSLLKMDSTSFLTNKDIKDSTNTVFINFSPTCDHCQRTIRSILDNIALFKNTQFVLSSFDEFPVVQKFYFDYALNSFPTVFIGQEYDFTLTKQLQFSSFPCLVIFDANKHWIKKIEQETTAKTLLKVLKIKAK
ncbi:MAG: hypothetical protein U0U67_01365 [Chitinophagales bacterium]